MSLLTLSLTPCHGTQSGRSADLELMLGIREEVSQATLVPFLLFTFPTLARSRKSREMEESSVNHECYVI